MQRVQCVRVCRNQMQVMQSWYDDAAGAAGGFGGVWGRLRGVCASREISRTGICKKHADLPLDKSVYHRCLAGFSAAPAATRYRF